MAPFSRLNQKYIMILVMLEETTKPAAVLVTFTGKEKALLV